MACLVEATKEWFGVESLQELQASPHLLNVLGVFLGGSGLFWPVSFASVVAGLSSCHTLGFPS